MTRRRKHVGRWWRAGVVVIAMVSAVADAATTGRDDWPPPASELTDEDVTAAMETIVAAMLADVDPQRGWDPARWTSSWGSTTQAGGYTALAALALVQAGTSPHAPGLGPAIDLVRAAELTGTYAVAMRACLLSRLPPDRREGLREDIDRLIRSLNVETGSWNYRIGQQRARRDNSLRQFGALALWDAASAGLAIPSAVWAIIDRAFIDAQRPDGGWNYLQNDAPSRGSLTAAAVATLMITDEQLAGVDPDPETAAARRAAIDRGIEWLGRRFDATRNPGMSKWFLYYAYSIERVGLAAGLVDIGGHDWFRELGRSAIDRACRRTSDGRIVLRRDRRNRVDDLAFTLLLLSRGRVPLLAGKLVIPDSATDERPRDVGLIARVTGTALESEMGWRRVDATAAVEDWLSVPVLVCAGAGPLPARGTPTGDRLRDHLAAFLDAGGWLLAVDEGDGRLHRDLTEVITTIRPRAVERRAERTHPAYAFHRDPGRRPPVRLLHDGVRDLAVLLRGDDWLRPPPPPTASRSRGRRPGGTRASAARVDPHHAVLLNLALAATADVPPGPRLAARPGDPRVAGRAALEDRAVAPTDAGSPARVTMRRLRHAGHWNAVPGAEAALAAWATAADLMELVVERPWRHGDATDLLLVTGTAAPTPDDAARLAADIMAASRAGGRVLVTTAGGGGAFSRAVEAALMSAGCPTPRRDVANGLLAAATLPVERVRWTRALASSLGPRPTAPRLRATAPSAEPADAADADAPAPGLILISHEDLLVGVLGRGAWGIRGHVPSSARRVLAAIAVTSGRMPAAPEE